MNYTNKHFYLFPFFLLLNISCSTSKMSVMALNYTPSISESFLKNKVIRSEKKANTNLTNPDLLFNASKNLTIYSFGFTVDSADRIKQDDYKKSLKKYAQANSDFSRAVKYIDQSILTDYPNYDTWLNGGPNETPLFDISNIDKLYWSAAAYAGAIQSSNGDPEWVIQLPKIGLLLETALSLNPEWNYGALYTAMISYSLIRHDAKENKVEIAKAFFDKAIKASNGEDLSPYITYAENIAVSEQNKKEFTNMLYKALNIDIHANPELSLTNYINQKRANWLLDNIDEFFY